MRLHPWCGWHVSATLAFWRPARRRRHARFAYTTRVWLLLLCNLDGTALDELCRTRLGSNLKQGRHLLHRLHSRALRFGCVHFPFQANALRPLQASSWHFVGAVIFGEQGGSARRSSRVPPVSSSEFCSALAEASICGARSIVELGDSAASPGFGVFGHAPESASRQALGVVAGPQSRLVAEPPSPEFSPVPGDPETPASCSSPVDWDGIVRVLKSKV